MVFLEIFANKANFSHLLLNDINNFYNVVYNNREENLCTQSRCNVRIHVSAKISVTSNVAVTSS